MRNIILLIFIFIPSFLNGQIYIENPDTSISGIKLQDPSSLISKIPNIKSLIDSKGPEIRACLLNKDETEKAELIFHAGSSANEVAEIHVYAIDNKTIICSKPIKLDIDKFVTESNISLFMTRKEVVKKKGKIYVINHINGEVILYYTLNDFENSKFLKRYNYPEYHATYTFKRDRLIKMDFGFTYP
jgi:hypothetical protein